LWSGSGEPKTVFAAVLSFVLLGAVGLALVTRSSAASQVGMLRADEVRTG